jgi:hypothetical protein
MTNKSTNGQSTILGVSKSAYVMESVHTNGPAGQLACMAMRPTPDYEAGGHRLESGRVYKLIQ